MVVQPESDERRTQEERRTAAKDALLNAAAELIAEQGVVETSMAQIGERAGYSRGLANHHFGSKAELIEQLSRRVQRAFAGSLGNATTTSGLDAILTLVRAYVGHFENPSSHSGALLVMWGANLPAQSAVVGIAEADERFRQAVARLVERGQADGSIDAEVNPGAFSVALIGLLRGVTAQCLTDREAIDLHAVQTECARFITVGLSPTNTKKGK